MSPDLVAHVHQLAAQYGIVVVPWWAGELAEDCVEFPCGAAGELELEDGMEMFLPVIWVSEEPSTAKAYLVALHELGHHVTPEPGPCSTLLEREERAWLWAEQQSLIPITKRLRAFIERRLDSYRD